MIISSAHKSLLLLKVSDVEKLVIPKWVIAPSFCFVRVLMLGMFVGSLRMIKI